MLAIIIASIVCMTIGILIGRGDSRRDQPVKTILLMPSRVYEARNPDATRKS